MDAVVRYERARDRLADCLSALEPLLSPAGRQEVRAARDRLARGTFVLAVVGEFSSGKSFLLNALLGKLRYEEVGGAKRIAGLLAVDINPTTAAITELQYGPVDEAYATYEDGHRERIALDALNRFIAVGTTDPGTLHDAQSDGANAPVRVAVSVSSPFLERGFAVADTPGLASANPAHRRTTLAFLPNADAVLYLIDTQQPFTEGDASFLGIIREHIESIFIVQTKIDLWEQPQGDGRPAWEHAHERIVRMAAIHAPDTPVYAVSALDYARGTLDADAAIVARSRFPEFLGALDASLVDRTGRQRLLAACRAGTQAAQDTIARIDRDLSMLALDRDELLAARDAMVPHLQDLAERTGAQSAEVASMGRSRSEAIARRGALLCEELDRALTQAFDTADVARLRDRERLHMIVDRVFAGVAGEFAQDAASAVLDDLDRALERAQGVVMLHWSPRQAAARAFGAPDESSLWNGDARKALATTIVFEAIAGPAIGLVSEVAERFAAHPPGAYMKRELSADLRAEIMPKLDAQTAAFASRTGDTLQRIYEDLSRAIDGAAVAERDAATGSVETALDAHRSASVEERTRTLREQRQAIDAAMTQAPLVVEAFEGERDAVAPAGSGPAIVLASHAMPAFDRDAYDRGLRPERWRVAVLGALRRGKSSLIDAFAQERVLADDVPGSARFPIHVRYGPTHQAFALGEDARWHEIAYEQASAKAAGTPVLILVPWDLPPQLVLVHAPPFDSGDPHAEDVNVVVAGHASESLCLFSRQLSDRELDLYERVSAFGKPMLFVHTLADNEAPRERRRVVELAGQYLQGRHVGAERIFVVSSHDYAAARREGRAAAPWNEAAALRATLEAHAQAHMARLERAAKASLARAPEPRDEPRPKGGLFAGLFVKGR